MSNQPSPHTEPVDKETAALHEKLIAQLEAAGHKVLRPFVAKDDFTPDGFTMPEDAKILMVLDFEATGKEPLKDLPIEIGFVRVEYDPATGTMGRVVERYSGLEDPGFELIPEVERVTGLNRSMLLGHRFDDEHINASIQASDFIIAHNANYDRNLGERRFPALMDRPWGCSMAEGPWEEMNVGAKGQEFLAFKVAGIHYGAHRAQADCEALSEILASPAHDGRSCLANILEKARKPSYTVWAQGSPFEKKDVLRNEGGYRWNADDPGKIAKTWYKDRVTDLSAAFEFLRDHIYGHPATWVTVDKMTALERYSSRFQARDRMQLNQAPASGEQMDLLNDPAPALAPAVAPEKMAAQPLSAEGSGTPARMRFRSRP